MLFNTESYFGMINNTCDHKTGVKGRFNSYIDVSMSKVNPLFLLVLVLFSNKEISYFWISRYYKIVWR
jgi:hypothetical protein